MLLSTLKVGELPSPTETTTLSVQQDITYLSSMAEKLVIDKKLPIVETRGAFHQCVLSVFVTDKFALSQSDARISVAYNSFHHEADKMEETSVTRHEMKLRVMIRMRKLQKGCTTRSQDSYSSLYSCICRRCRAESHHCCCWNVSIILRPRECNVHQSTIRTLNGTL